jgi:hypothetical protein
MWGNWQGWSISATMVLVTAGVFYRLANPPPESSPTGLLKDAYAEIKLPFDLKQVAPLGTRSADAGALYRRAILRYRENTKPYDDPIHAKPGELPSLPLFLEAGDCSRMTLFESNPQQLVNYGNGGGDMEAILKIADSSNTIGLGNIVDAKEIKDVMEKQRKLDAARPYFNAVFSLGMHLFDERVTWREMKSGMSVMSDAMRNLAQLADEAHDSARGDALRKDEQDLDRYRDTLEENVASPLNNPVESYASKYAGDIFAIAKETSVDRVWRVSAILHLGRYRWNVADDRGGDQVWAVRELRAMDNSVDPKNTAPVILAAIHAARGMPLQQQRLSGWRPYRQATLNWLSDADAAARPLPIKTAWHDLRESLA